MPFYVFKTFGKDFISLEDLLNVPEMGILLKIFLIILRCRRILKEPVKEAVKKKAIGGGRSRRSILMMKAY